MDWTELHGPLLGRAFDRVLGRAAPGTMAFVRCLTPDVVAALAADKSFAPVGWRVSRVADVNDEAARTITADAAVEWRESKGEPALLLDTTRAGAGMDGIYSAAREIDEVSLFTEAQRLAAAAVTDRMSSGYRAYAERAIRRAQGFGRQYSVSPWAAFDFLCRIAVAGRHPGAYLHLLGLWPVAASNTMDAETELDISRRFVDRLLGVGAAGVSVPARIESLRIVAADEERRDLERFLREAETRPLLDALRELASRDNLWVGVLPIEPSDDIQEIKLTPWRGRTGRIAKWSGLTEASETDPPELILRSDAESSKDYSKLEVKWKALPTDLDKNAVEYRVAVVTDQDEELAARDVSHSAQREEKCSFGNDDFAPLSDDALVSARVVVSVIGRDAVDKQETEEFVIRFGEPPEKIASGAGRKVRTFSEGVIDLAHRETVEAIAANPTSISEDSKGFVLLRPSETRQRKSFRVFRPSLIREVENRWTSLHGALGRWQVKVRASGAPAGPVEFLPANGTGGDGAAWGRTVDHMVDALWRRAAVSGGAAWDRTVAASAKLAKRFEAGGGGVGQIHDDQAKAFDVTKEYVLAWTALIETGNPSLALCNTVEVQSLSGGTIGLIVLPAHPLRVAWLAAYDNLLLHAVFEQRQAASEVRNEVAGLDGAMFPAFLPNPAGGAFVFADTLGFHAVGMVPDGDREPKAALAMLARAFGEAAPTVGGESASVLGREILKYMDCHESSRLARVHALRAGDGLTIARALGHVFKQCRDEDANTADEAATGAANVDSAAAPAFSLDLYPSTEQRGVAGRFIAEAREKRRSGAGVVADDDRWMLESLSLPGGVKLPRLRWARKEGSDPETAAHIAVAFDTFESRVERQPTRETTTPFRAFGLLSFFEREFIRTPSPVWYSTVPAAGGGEKHPSERGHTERLVRIQRAIQNAVAQHLAIGTGPPVLCTEISPEKADSIRNLHRLCDWVVTLDRNAGVEYFDSPRDDPKTYDAYVIDCVPEREDLGCLQLVTSSSNVDEVHDLLDEALDRMSLSHSRRNARFLLDHLKALSGRLAIRLTGHRAPAAELVALSIARAHCQRATDGDDCWVSLDRGFLVPVDDVRDLLPPLQGLEDRNDDDDSNGNGENDGGGRQTRPDLIYVWKEPRRGLAFRFIEVKHRRHLREARAPDLLRTVHTQTSALRERWHHWYGHDGVCSAFRAVRRAKLARVLRFYADKALRHGMATTPYRDVAEEVDRMVEKGGEYAFHTVADGDRGWIFCPEYSGHKPLEISPAGSSTRVFLFGAGSLSDSDFRFGGAPPPTLVAGSTAGEPSRNATPRVVSKTEGVAAASHSSPSAVIDPDAETTPASPEPPPAPTIGLGSDTVTGAEVEWSLTVKGNPHLLVAGLPGMGKTTCLLSLCRQMVDSGVQPIVFSYHQDIDERLADLVESVRFIDFRGLGFNPLKVVDRMSSTAHLDVAGSLRDIFGAIYPDLGDLQGERVRSAIKESFVEAGWGVPKSDPPEPAFKRFVEILRNDPKPDRGLKTLLARLGELEDYGFFESGDSRESLWESDRPVVVRIHGTQNDVLQRAFASLVFYGLYKDMFRRGIQERITHALIFDEAHRAAALKLIPTMAKECRKYGISLVLASQEARDFDVSLFSAIANYLVLRLTEADAKALVRNVATVRQERTLIDRLKQMDRFKALYFCEGKQRPALVSLRSL